MNANNYKEDLISYKNECVICFEIIEKELKFNCQHHFCKDCILKWIKIGQTTCPVCRDNIIFINFNNKDYNIEEFKNIDSKNIICFFNPTVINFLFSIFCLLLIYIIHQTSINNHQQTNDYNENKYNEKEYSNEYNLG